MENLFHAEKLATYWHALSSGQFNGHNKANGLTFFECAAYYSSVCLVRAGKRH